MEEIESKFKAACALYNSRRPHLTTCGALALAALSKLHTASYSHYHQHIAHNQSVNYGTFQASGGVSRPIAMALFVHDQAEFENVQSEVWTRLGEHRALTSDEEELVNKYIYTCVMALAAAYDLWKPGSRKSPGTYFEVLMAALVGHHSPQYALTKHVSLGALLGDEQEATAREDTEVEEAVDEDGEEAGSSVSTDLVVGSSTTEKSAVIPLKITTRERVVQPFAHQRILESSFPGRYHSFLCCISETQLDKKKRVVKQICVPGTIRLFQKFLSKMDGLYYCDIPARYSQPSLTRLIPVKTLGALFNDLDALLA